MTEEESKFPGFQSPQENWSKLPHQLIEALPNITSQGELMVILYILRHTWGYREYGQPKRITLDEFMHGRKTKSKEYPTGRMDGGVGMSKDAILRGLKRAEKHGFIEIEIDDSDKARIKKYYVLRMSESQTPDSPDVRKSDPEVLESDSQVGESDSSGMDSIHRSEKETLERNSQKETEKESPDFPENSEEKPFDAGTEKMWEHWRTAEANQKGGDNFSTPAHAGGADAAAGAALAAMYLAIGSQPPREGTRSWVDSCGKVGQVLRDRGMSDPEQAKRAGKLFGEANRETLQFVNPHQSTFPEAFGVYVGKVMSQPTPQRPPLPDDYQPVYADEPEPLPTPDNGDCPVGSAVKGILARQMQGHIFDEHVAGATFAVEDGCLVVTAHDEDGRLWLASRLEQTIKRALAGFEKDAPKRVRFEVGE